MYQPKKEILQTSYKTEIKRIGHNLDTSRLNYSVEDNCERQANFSISLPQAKNISITLNHHTLYFETLLALHSYQFCAPSLVYLNEKTILKDSKNYSVFHNNRNTNEQIMCCFQSNPEIQKLKKDQNIFSKGEMSPFET